jgi:hypothetical protein
MTVKSIKIYRIYSAAATALSLVLIFSSCVFSEMGMGEMGGGHGGGRRGHQEGAAQQRQPQQKTANLDIYLRQILTYEKELCLTTGQVEAIMKLRSDMMKEAQKSYTDLGTTERELADILSKDTPDFAKAKTKIKDLTDIALYSQSLSLDTYEKAFNLLSDDQKKMLAEIRSEQRKKTEAYTPDLSTENKQTGHIKDDGFGDMQGH